MPDSNDNRNASSEKNGFHPIVPANFLPAKGQLISNANFEVFIWTKKTNENISISALVSKMGQMIKTMAHYHAN